MSIQMPNLILNWYYYQADMKRIPARSALIFAIFLLALAVYWGGALLRDTRLREMRPRTMLGQEEACLDCHGNMTGFSPFHDPDQIGCTSCHLGDPLAKTERKAHRGMVLIPGNLSNVYQTCGTANCHQAIADRISHSLMTTMAGVITVDRFVFGQIDTLTAYAHVKELGHSAADTHLRHLCASCHLGNEKEEYGLITERSRGGGCLACHLNSPIPGAEAPVYSTQFHPSVTLQVSNDHCFGCHSRSGRISLSYEGWHETLLSPDEAKNRDKRYRVLQDGRVVQMVAPDIHHERGLDCIDCHSAREVMGDGTTYLHQEDAVKTGCVDCHFAKSPETVGMDGLIEEDRKILAVRGINATGQRFAVGEESGEPVWNVWVDPVLRAIMIGKIDGEKHPLKPPAPICTRKGGHAALTCDACHSAWAPQCVGCHTAFDPKVQAYDLLDKKKTRGKWEEYLGGFFADPPVLGVVETMDMDEGKIREIKTFVPGMIMTLDQSAFPGGKKDTVFHRLYAPLASHTTAAKGRSCESCHNDPLAIGYGRGELEYQVLGKKGRWSFTPEYISSPDGLPQDAWIGFLREPSGRSTTRPNARPFTLAEQKRILAVGACLTCHDGNSEIMMRSIDDFGLALKRVSQKCVLPEFISSEKK